MVISLRHGAVPTQVEFDTVRKLVARLKSGVAAAVVVVAVVLEMDEEVDAKSEEARATEQAE